jgi:amino acid transporter
MTATIPPRGASTIVADGDSKGLRPGALGLMSSTVMAIASVAPAYSLASTLAIVAAAVLTKSPIIMILAFVPMFLVATAYQQLNRREPDCGTTFTWGTKTFGPTVGWMGGWGIIAADVIVMANLAQIAGQYGFELVGANGLAGSTGWTTFAGVVWIVLMTVICYIGIEISANIQYVLLGVEMVMLSIFSVTALVEVITGNGIAGSHVPEWSWFNPVGVSGGFSGLTSGIIAAVFIYWGWDTAVSVNEECKDKDRVPGIAAVSSTFILLGIYVLVTTATVAYAGLGTKGLGLLNSNNAGDVLSVLGKSVFGSGTLGTVLAKLLVLMVLTSSAASTLTTILPTARTSLAMAAYRAIPRKFAQVHPRFLTPTWSTIGMGTASVVFYVALAFVSGGNVLADTIASVGLMIAFYYGLTGFACFWYFRRELRTSREALIWKGIAPLLGGVLLLVFFVKAAWDDWNPNTGYTSWTLPFSPHWHIGGVFLTGIGALVFGVVLMLVYRAVAPPFFRGQVLTRATPTLVPEDAGVPVAGIADIE